MILIRVTIILMTVTAIPTIPITVSIITFCTFRVIFHYVSPPEYRKFSNVNIRQKVNRLPFRVAPESIITQNILYANKIINELMIIKCIQNAEGIREG